MGSNSKITVGGPFSPFTPRHGAGVRFVEVQIKCWVISPLPAKAWIDQLIAWQLAKGKLKGG